jgi:predicted DCC family thiol-disulfide oxidoreductase YuxK
MMVSEGERRRRTAPAAACARQPFSFRGDPTVPAFPADVTLVVYDGVCGVCSGWVRFILRRDRTRVRHNFASSQSVLGSALYRHYGYDPADPETLLVIKDGVMHAKRDAIAIVLAELGPLWKALARLSRLVPARVAERAYDTLAENRYRIWGQSSACMRPPPGTEARFLS